MRVFAAICLSDEMKASLTGTMHEMKKAGVKGSYVPMQNLHLTLAFIGEIRDGQAVKDALSTVSFKPFRLSLSGTGSFGDLIWVGSHDHTLYAFDPADGTCRHQIECGGQINATPVFDAGRRHLFLGNCDGIIRRIDLQTGKVSGELDCESPIPAQPRLVDGTLYVQTHGGELIAADTASMTVRWKQAIRSGSVSEPFVTASFAVANVTGNTFPVFDRKSGAPAGTLEADEPLAPIRSGDDKALYGVTFRGVLYRWTRKEENWQRTRLTVFQTDCRNGCFRYGNRLLVADESGGLFYHYLEDTGDAP